MRLDEIGKAQSTGADTAAHIVARHAMRAADPAGQGSRVFVEMQPELAIEAAQAADLRRRAGNRPGVLSGVPVSVKDNIDVAGQRTRAGSRVLEQTKPALRDSPAVGRLRAAGASLLGRTNMTEFAYGAHGYNATFGTPLNPYRRQAELLPGGSSSGAAVSVSDEMVAAAVGTDTAGSCRIPAALCGVVGFKPSADQIPVNGVFCLAPSLDVVGVLGGSVDCCWQVFRVMAGRAGSDPVRWSAPPRLGLLTGSPLESLDPVVEKVFSEAVAALVTSGAVVTELRLPIIDASLELGAELLAGEAAAVHRPYLETSSELYDPWLLNRLQRGLVVDTARQQELGVQRQLLAVEARRALAAFDAVLMPTVRQCAPPLADIMNADNRTAVNRELIHNTAVANVIDVPAISLPCSVTGDPAVGLSLMASNGDAALIAVARWVELALCDAPEPSTRKAL